MDNHMQNAIFFVDKTLRQVKTQNQKFYLKLSVKNMKKNRNYQIKQIYIKLSITQFECIAKKQA